MFKRGHVVSDGTEPGLEPRSVFPKPICLTSLLNSESLNDLSRVIWLLSTDFDP